MTTKINFTDSACASLTLSSLWRSSHGDSTRDQYSQTPSEFYKFCEVETQTGICTEIYQDQVTGKSAGTTLFDCLSGKFRGHDEKDWKTKIENGFVTVDCEVATDPSMKMETDFFIECVNVKCDVEVWI